MKKSIVRFTVMTAELQRHSSTRPRPVGVTVWVSNCDSSVLDTRISDNYVGMHISYI